MVTRTIAIAGTQPHIGTTTQAIQLIQYLQLMGNKVCYVEMNTNNYIQNLQNTYEDIERIEDGHIKFEHVELYDAKHIKGLMKKEYDYIVKDYGDHQSGFNEPSYIEQDIKIFVGGVKPNEVFFTYEILKQPEFDDVSFIISFVDAAAQEDVGAMFDYTVGHRKYNRSSRVYFANYAPEPFEYTGISNKTYSDLLNAGGPS